MPTAIRIRGYNDALEARRRRADGEAHDYPLRLDTKVWLAFETVRHHHSYHDCAFGIYHEDYGFLITYIWEKYILHHQTPREPASFEDVQEEINRWLPAGHELHTCLDAWCLHGPRLGFDNSLHYERNMEVPCVSYAS